MRLVDDNNEQVGVIDITEAKRRAKEAGLDLVEVSPQSSPPVCRIMDYGKWKYQQRKKEQKARSHSKQSELKEVRLRPQIDPHDLEIKTKHAREFLGEGHKVQFTMQFKGREMAHRELGTELMNDVARSMEDISRKEDPKEPRAMGKRMTMTLIPERKGATKPKDEAEPRTPNAPAPRAAQPPRQPAVTGVAPVARPAAAPGAAFAPTVRPAVAPAPAPAPPGVRPAMATGAHSPRPAVISGPRTVPQPARPTSAPASPVPAPADSKPA